MEVRRDGMAGETIQRTAYCTQASRGREVALSLSWVSLKRLLAVVSIPQSHPCRSQDADVARRIVTDSVPASSTARKPVRLVAMFSDSSAGDPRMPPSPKLHSSVKTGVPAVQELALIERPAASALSLAEPASVMELPSVNQKIHCQLMRQQRRQPAA